MRAVVGDTLVTGHALARFRERIDPAATAELVAGELATADPAEDWVEEAFSNIPAGSELWVKDDAVFVVAPTAAVRFGATVGPTRTLITVLLLEWAESKRDRDSGGWWSPFDD